MIGWWGRSPKTSKTAARARGGARLRPGAVRRSSSSRPPEGLSSEDGQEKLASALSHPDPSIRARAVAMAVELSTAGMTSILRVMIHDPSPIVRAAAATAAGRTAGVESVDLGASLIVALSDPEPEVRRAAILAVSRLTGQPVASGPDAVVPREEIQVLKQWWKEQRLAVLSREMLSRETLSRETLSPETSP